MLWMLCCGEIARWGLGVWFFVWLFWIFFFCKNAVYGFPILLLTPYTTDHFTLRLFWGKTAHGSQVCWEARALPQPFAPGRTAVSFGNWNLRTAAIHWQNHPFPSWEELLRSAAVSAVQFQSPQGVSALVSPRPNTCDSSGQGSSALTPQSSCQDGTEPFSCFPRLSVLQITNHSEGQHCTCLYLHLWPALDHCLHTLTLSSSWRPLLIWFPQFASDFSDLSCNTVPS